MSKSILCGERIVNLSVQQKAISALARRQSNAKTPSDVASKQEKVGTYKWPTPKCELLKLEIVTMT